MWPLLCLAFIFPTIYGIIFLADGFSWVTLAKAGLFEAWVLFLIVQCLLMEHGYDSVGEYIEIRRMRKKYDTRQRTP